MGLTPYHDYKNSRLPWAGDIPEHWETWRNGRLFAQRNETGHGDLPILEVSLRTGVRVRDMDNLKRKQMMSDREKYKRAARGDIAYNMIPSNWRDGRAIGGFPLVNLSENSESYILRAEIPGMQAEELDIKATAKSVSISGERHIAQEGENGNYHRQERKGGRFSRTLAISSEIDPDKVEAKLENGVLTLRLPKTEASKTKQIPITLS